VLPVVKKPEKPIANEAKIIPKVLRLDGWLDSPQMLLRKFCPHAFQVETHSSNIAGNLLLFVVLGHTPVVAKAFYHG